MLDWVRKVDVMATTIDALGLVEDLEKAGFLRS
jgi:hypothetical protein